MNDGSRNKAHSVHTLREHGLVPFRRILPTELFSKIWPSVCRSSVVIIPEIVFWLMACVALGDGAMAGAPIAFWATLRQAGMDLPLEPVCEEAFCTARRLLPLEFFGKLFHEVIRGFSETFDDRFLWRGFRLRGIDGTTLNLPSGAPALTEAFPPPSNQKGAGKHPQALMVGLVDLWSGLCCGFITTPLKKAEQFGARWVLRYLGPKDLLLGDRNFPNYAYMAQVLETGAHFLMRLKGGVFTGAKYKRTLLGRSDDWLVTIHIPDKVKKEFPLLPATLTLRILKYQLPGFRPSYLITSLTDPQLYPYEDLVALYHERWRQETAHREWKHTLQLSNLRSKSPQGIVKEIYVQLTLHNVIRWMMAEAAGAPSRPVDLQFKACKRLVLAATVRMATARASHITEMYRHLLQEMSKQVIRVRPGRSYPRRKNESKGRNKGRGEVAASARLPTAEGTCVSHPGSATSQTSGALARRQPPERAHELV